VHVEPLERVVVEFVLRALALNGDDGFGPVGRRRFLDATSPDGDRVDLDVDRCAGGEVSPRQSRITADVERGVVGSPLVRGEDNVLRR
jgi:hypothetical protein